MKACRPAAEKEDMAPAGSAVVHFEGTGDQHLALAAAPVPAFWRIGVGVQKGITVSSISTGPTAARGRAPPWSEPGRWVTE